MDHKSNEFYKFAFVDPSMMFKAIFPVKEIIIIIINWSSGITSRILIKVTVYTTVLAV